MHEYIIRVQLNSDQYDTLKNGLLSLGFGKVISSPKSKAILPQGNYILQTTKSIEDVLELVKRVALKVDSKSLILVTKSAGSSWYNLS